MNKTKVILFLLVLLSLALMLSAEVRQLDSRSLYQNQASIMQNRQTFLNEQFNGPDFPPTGWSIDAQESHWTMDGSNNAGGTAPEAHFNYAPQFVGYSRLITPNINTLGQTSLVLEFKHFVDWYAVPMTVGVATRSNNGAWNVVWSVNATANVSGTVNVTVENADINSETTQLCFYFSGDSYNIDEWYIDDILFYSPEAHDYKPMEILADMQYTAGVPMVPAVKVKNNGLTDETGDVVCKIFQFDQEVYSQTVPATIAIGQTQDVSFPEFTPELDNEMYKILAYTALAGDLDHTNDTLSVMFDTYNTPKQKVILEIGTGTWCQYCPGAAMGAEDLIANGKEVGVVEYHNGDAYVTPSGTIRIEEYYNISGFPTAIFDGTTALVGGDHSVSLYPDYLPIYEEKYAVKTPFLIGFTGEVVNDILNVNVSVNRFGRFLNPNIVLQFALTESDITVSWQGQDHLDFVERAMAPDAYGTALNLIDTDSLTVNLSMPFNQAWDFGNMEIVAFIQDPLSKFIYNGNSVKLNDLQPISNSEVVLAKNNLSLHANYPNPFNPSTTISFELSKTENVQLEIYNVKGQKVKTLVNGMQTQGLHNVVWNGLDDSGKTAASGMYFYQLSNAKETISKKMLLIK